MWNRSNSAERRFMPLNVVELKIGSSSKLPDALCDGVTSVQRDSSADSGVNEPMTYPSPDDPRLTCSDNGLSFTYKRPCTPSVTTPATTEGGLWQRSRSQKHATRTSSCTPRARRASCRSSGARRIGGFSSAYRRVATWSKSEWEESARWRTCRSRKESSASSTIATLMGAGSLGIRF